MIVEEQAKTFCMLDLTPAEAYWLLYQMRLQATNDHASNLACKLRDAIRTAVEEIDED